MIGFVLFLVWAFPGYMSTDSTNQLLEARSGEFSDAHPPLMSAYWRLFDLVVSGPLLMLLLQGVLFLGGLYLLLVRVLAPRAAAITASAILLFPPVLAPMAVIWKDSQMAAFLVAGTALLLNARLKIRLVGFGLLIAACAVRHNGFAAVVPIVFFMFEWRSGMRWWKRTAYALVAAVLAVAAMFAVTKVLTVNPIRLTPAFQDIVGVIAFSEPKSDEELRHVLRGLPLQVTTNIQEHCKKLHRDRGAWRITQGDERLMDYLDEPAEWDALSRAWKEVVLAHPRAYFAYHWDVYARMLGIEEIPRAPIWNLFVEQERAVDALRHNAYHSTAQIYLSAAFYWLADHTPLFRPWVYAVIGLLLLVLCVRDRVTAGLLASGFLYELSYFPVGADPDYRYSHWMITTIVIAAVILFVERRRMR